jgi:hypothetical protein
VLIGIDLDNTIACYDAGFLELAREMRLVPDDFRGGKKAVRDAVRSGAGEIAWQRLQARLYGREIARARVADGLDVLLERARARNIPVAVISHKTQFSPFDPDTDLRLAATRWMEANGLFDPRGMGVAPEQVYFEGTREDKIRRIRAVGCTHFIDDLDEVFNEPAFPGHVRSYLYAAGYDEIPQGPFRPFRSHRDIADHLLGAAPEAAAAALLGARPSSVIALAKGGNNRLYRITDEKGVVALKCYPSPDGDPRDRLAAEFNGLSFLKACREPQVPAPIAMSRPLNVALFEWIDGEPVGNPTSADIDAALAFLRRLHGYRLDAAAAGLPLASEACLSGAEVVRQLAVREEKLVAVAPLRGELARLLDCLREERDRLAVPIAGSLADALAPEHRTLSPSDFGFHNAVRRSDGSIVFLDFEYFGWDDPIKLAADFLLHPGMTLDRVARRRFASGMAEMHSADPGFRARLARVLPLYALRWCLILLNAFLPGRQARRAVAGGGDRAAVEAGQLAKAWTMLRTIPHVREDLP